VIYFFVFIIIGSYLIPRIEKNSLRLTEHQTGEIKYINIFHYLMFLNLSIIAFKHGVFIFQFFCYCFFSYLSYYLIWTIVGRPGMREEMGRGDVFGQIIHFVALFFIMSFVIVLDSPIINIIFSYYLLIFPILYPIYIFITKNGWMMK
jgi:hypothetical protein